MCVSGREAVSANKGVVICWDHDWAGCWPISEIQDLRQQVAAQGKEITAQGEQIAALKAVVADLQANVPISKAHWKGRENTPGLRRKGKVFGYRGAGAGGPTGGKWWLVPANS
jgi:hypothetical protein